MLFILMYIAIYIYIYIFEYYGNTIPGWVPRLVQEPRLWPETCGTKIERYIYTLTPMVGCIFLCSSPYIYIYILEYYSNTIPGWVPRLVQELKLFPGTCGTNKKTTGSIYKSTWLDIYSYIYRPLSIYILKYVGNAIPGWVPRPAREPRLWPETCGTKKQRQVRFIKAHGWTHKVIYIAFSIYI